MSQLYADANNARNVVQQMRGAEGRSIHVTASGAQLEATGGSRDRHKTLRWFIRANNNIHDHFQLSCLL